VTNTSNHPQHQPLSGRRFVLLQGPASRFSLHLGHALGGRGAQVTRIGFSPADRLFWSARGGGYIPFRRPMAQFPAFLDQVLADTGATDLLMLGDGRDPHRLALDLLDKTGAAVTPWIYELGYLRPNLLTIFNGVTGPTSGFDPSGAYDAAPQQSFSHSFFRTGALDFGWHLTNALLSWATYPHYRSHAIDGPVREYSGWARKGLASARRKRAAATALARIAAHTGPIFLVPLQLDTDFQLRLRGTGRPQVAELDETIRSFRDHASEQGMLVVKVHPLDNGLRHWGQVIMQLAEDAGISDRVVALDGGQVEPLLDRLAGVITINSTVGLSAVLAGVPTLVLGQAIYDRPGLTEQHDRHRFWGQPTPPDPALAANFGRFLRSAVHVPGTFDGPGAPIGAANIARFIADQAP